jgi:hypothetical protein
VWSGRYIGVLQAAELLASMLVMRFSTDSLEQQFHHRGTQEGMGIQIQQEKQAGGSNCCAAGRCASAVRFCQLLRVRDKSAVPCCSIQTRPYNIRKICVRAYLEECSRPHSQGPAPNLLLLQLQTKPLPVQVQKPTKDAPYRLGIGDTRCCVPYGQAAEIMARAAGGRGW